ncbi:hypothetical protein SAMN02983003_0292 [Devosia enhydra]|uniref:Uncharacterized protein n=1 Tax=Devosia enhydra TaxID=665118 RepID=A0A1K2HSV9_9HYPH|nr:hypothetical protein [Devosia enhydra]SFZ81064.1 hypothetical protein SAMN02983003_0292 [Devosia enhydra]
MTNVQELIEKLRPIGERIQHWRAEAVRIRAMTDETYASQSVEEARLQQVEEIAGQIYREIETFDAIVAEISDASPAAAAELSDVGNALQLILLEITELGTGMYSVHSGLPIANPAADGSIDIGAKPVAADIAEAEKSEAAPVSN